MPHSKNDIEKLSRLTHGSSARLNFGRCRKSACFAIFCYSVNLGFSQEITATPGEHFFTGDSSWMLSDIFDKTTGLSLYGGSARSYCFEFSASSPTVGLPQDYVAYDTIQTQFFRNKALLTATDIQEAAGMIAWIFDNYYDSYGMYYFNDPAASDAVATTQGFHRAIWEVQTDFDGTYASLDTATGKQISTSTVNVAMGPSAAKTMEIIDVLKLNSEQYYETYTSSRFQFAYLDTKTAGFQNELLVIDSASPVPEPSVTLFSVSAGLLLLFRRKRNAGK